MNALLLIGLTVLLTLYLGNGAAAVEDTANQEIEERAELLEQELRAAYARERARNEGNQTPTGAGHQVPVANVNDAAGGAEPEQSPIDPLSLDRYWYYGSMDGSSAWVRDLLTGRDYQLGRGSRLDRFVVERIRPTGLTVRTASGQETIPFRRSHELPVPYEPAGPTVVADQWIEQDEASQEQAVREMNDRANRTGNQPGQPNPAGTSTTPNPTVETPATAPNTGTEGSDEPMTVIGPETVPPTGDNTTTVPAEGEPGQTDPTDEQASAMLGGEMGEVVDLDGERSVAVPAGEETTDAETIRRRLEMARERASRTFPIPPAIAQRWIEDLETMLEMSPIRAAYSYSAENFVGVDIRPEPEAALFEQVGLRPNDRIIALNGTRIRIIPDLERVGSELDWSSTVTVTIERGMERREIYWVFNQEAYDSYIDGRREADEAYEAALAAERAESEEERRLLEEAAAQTGRGGSSSSPSTSEPAGDDTEADADGE